MIRRLLQAMGWARRAVRVPTRLQFQTTECGVAALAMVLAHHGRHVSIEALREVTGVSRDCVNAAEIARAARHFGMECRAYSREPKDLGDLPLPFLAHLRFIHFVVVEGFAEDGTVLVVDPASGRSDMSALQFDEAFTGVVLSFAPGQAFQVEGREVHPVGALWARAGAPLRRLALSALGAGLAGVLALASLPLLIGQWTDAPAGEARVMAMLLPVLAVASILLLAWSRRATGRLYEALVQGHARHLADHFLAMPPGFFAYRLPSRLHGILYAGEVAARLLCGDLLPGMLRASMALFALALLLAVHPPAGLLAATVMLVYWGLVAATWHWHRNPGLLRGKASSDTKSMLFSRSELETAKLNGHADEFVLSRMGGRAGLLLGGQEGAGLNAWMHGSAMAAAFGLPLLMVLHAGQSLAAGAMGPGGALSLVLLACAAGAALRRAWLLPSQWSSLAHLLLPVQDVLDSQPEPAAADGQRRTVPAGLPGLADGVVLRALNLCFGYSRTRPPLVQAVSLELRRGEQLGITGPSGGGKSTLGALLTGDHVPWSGQIDHDAVLDTGAGWSVARVDKAAFFFEGTVRENLCLWNARIDDAQLQRAVRDACLDEVLAARPGGLDAPVLKRGENFSGGQRQRMEIARALLRDPQVLVLDEATDALDPPLEARLRGNIRARGCSLIMISHRASTLAACDRVLRVAGGQLVDALAVDGAQTVAEPVSGAGEAVSAAAAVVPAGPPVALAEEDDFSGQADRAALQSGLQRIAAALGTTDRRLQSATGHDAASDDPVPDNLQSLGLRAGLVLRRVRFIEPRWWTWNHGALLAFCRVDARVVVQGPAGAGKWQDALTGAPLDPDVGRDLHAVAWRCVALADDEPLPTLARVSRALRARTPEWGAAVLVALLWAAVLMVVPLLAMQEFTPVVSLAGTSGALQWMGGVAALLSIGLLEYVLFRVLLRVWGGAELRVLGEFVQRLPRLSQAFLRGASDETLGRSLASLEGLLQRLSAATRPGLDLLVCLMALGFLVSLHPALAVMVAAAGVAVCAVPWCLQAGPLRLEDELARQRGSEVRFLFDTLAGLFRLRLLACCEPAFVHWQQLLARNLVAARPVRALDDAQPWQRLSLPWLGLALLPAALTLLPPSWTSGLLMPLADRPWSLPACFVASWLALEAALEFSQAVQSWQRCRPMAQRADLLCTAPLEPPPARLPPAAALELQAVRYAWPGTSTPALHSVSLRIEPGEFLAITGPSGSGKSTLLRLLLGLEAPDAGCLRLGGVALEGGLLTGWRDAAGLVAQGDALESARTIRGQLCGSAPVNADEAWRAIEAVLMAEDVRRMPMGMQTIIESGKLSTGQEQRLLVARELLRRPRLLVLDEATNAIPDELQARLFERLRSLGITCVLVTHRESAIALMDRVVVIRDGGVAWSGAPGALAEHADLLAMLQAERQEGHL